MLMIHDPWPILGLVQKCENRVFEALVLKSPEYASKFASPAVRVLFAGPNQTKVARTA